VVAGVGGRRWGKPRGSPRTRFGGSEGAFEGSAGELGGARRWPPRRREIPARWGRIRATHGGGGLHGVPGRGRGSWTATERRGGRCSPSSPHGGRRRHGAVGGGRCVERGAAGGSHFMVYTRALATAGHLALLAVRRVHSWRTSGARRRTGGQT
jgi:hypothetical protein